MADMQNLDLSSEAFTSTASQEPRNTAVMAVTFTLGLVAIILRFLCRKKTGAGLWWDDWLSLAATAFNIVGFATYIAILRHFIGHHVGQIDANGIGRFGGAYFYGQLAYPIILTLSKLSILALYWRIFSNTARWPVIAAGVAAILIFLAWFFITVFQCTPVSQAWDLLATPRHCLSITTNLVYPPIPSIIEDAVIMIIPLPYIFRLQMRLTQKILVSSIFVVGSFIIIISILRLVLVHNVNEHDIDYTWNTSNILMWTAIETNMSVFLSSMPTLRPCIIFLKTGSFIGSSMKLSQDVEKYGTGGNSQKASKRSLFNRSQTKQGSRTTGPGVSQASTVNASDSNVGPDKQITVTKGWDVEYRADM